jgi:hypothetical protein
MVVPLFTGAMQAKLKGSIRPFAYSKSPEFGNGAKIITEQREFLKN